MKPNNSDLLNCFLWAESEA